MIKFENVEIIGWEAAVRGMRNPMNSWDKSDSYIGVDCNACGRIEKDGYCYPADHREECKKYEGYEIGTNDMNLMKRLAAGGPVHAKYRRMIIVYVDITAPLYWWKEFDTYKVGTVANSCSTMHKIAAKKFTLEDFSYENLFNEPENGYFGRNAFSSLIDELNKARNLYLSTKDKKYWYQMIQILPSSYNQKRTVMMNYEVLCNIYHSRKDHKLDEWHDFCDWIKTLPYSKLITG